jgi:hypothetical protein
MGPGKQVVVIDAVAGLHRCGDAVEAEARDRVRGSANV